MEEGGTAQGVGIEAVTEEDEGVGATVINGFVVRYFVCVVAER